MKSTLAPARILAATLVLGSMACQKNNAHDPEAQVPETTTGASATETTATTAKRPLMCEDPLEIVLPTPKDGGPTATFEVDPGGQIEPSLGCQSILFEGSEQEAKLSQGNETFTIAAHDTELQRIKVGHTTVLVHIPPGTHVKIGSHPCFSWQFLSPDLSVEGAKAPDATCISEEEDATCPEGMTKTRTRLAVDPLCENPEEPQMRCVKPTLVSLLPPSAWTNALGQCYGSMFLFKVLHSDSIAGRCADEYTAHLIKVHCWISVSVLRTEQFPVRGLSEYSILTFSELAREHQGHHQPTNQPPSERARARTFSEAVPEGIQRGLEGGSERVRRVSGGRLRKT